MLCYCCRAGWCALRCGEAFDGSACCFNCSSVHIVTYDKLGFDIGQHCRIRYSSLCYAHRMNETSSRSHAIVTLTMEQRARSSGPGVHGCKVSSSVA